MVETDLPAKGDGVVDAAGHDSRFLFFSFNARAQAIKLGSIVHTL